MKNRLNRLQFVKMGLDIDSWRGWESTGLALIPEGSKSVPIIYKRAVNGRDFIQLHRVEKYLNDIEKYPVVLGHNRAATTGRGNIVDHNAHPFQYGRITLVHNGHIRNTYELKGASEGAQCQVDSAMVAFAMNDQGEKEVLEQVEGGFTFVWWNSETNTLNIARNTERPLHMAFAAKENTFYWASELTQLVHLLKDTEIDEEIGVLYPKAWNWYQFNLKNLRDFKKIPFAKSQGRHTYITGTKTGGTEGGKDQREEISDKVRAQEDLDFWRKHSQNFQGISEIEEIRQTVANQRLKDVKMSGVPTSKKRMNRAQSELRKLGIDYNSMRNCEPISWCKYKNQANLGSVLCKTKREGYLVEVLQVRNEQYLEYDKLKNLLVDCVNVRNGPNNDVRIIGVVSSRMKDYMERVANKKEEVQEESNISSIERKYKGPDNIRITFARFKELASTGCANCQSNVEPIQHEDILWVGSPPVPICPECASDQGVMELLGIHSESCHLRVH